MNPAARALNVSQSSVSQALKQLEGHVGAALLDRRSRPAALTPAGRILVDAATVGIVALERALDDIRALGAEDARSVTVACNLGYATYWLMPQLHAFYAVAPEIHVNLQSVHRGQPGFANGAEIAIRFGDGSWPDCTAHRLFAERINPVCSAGYRARHGPFAHPRDLLGADLVHVDPVEPDWFDWPRYFAGLGVAAPATLPGQRFTNYVHAVQATSIGAGVMLGWRGITEPVAGQLDLVEALDAPLEPGTAVHACLATGRGERPAPRRFFDWLVALPGE